MQKNARIVLFFFMLIFLLGGFNYPAYSCDSAATLNKGRTALEIDWERIRYRNGDLDIYNHYYLYYGLADNLMLKLVVPFLVRQDAATGSVYNGKADTTLQFNYRFKDETKTAPALMVEVYKDFNNSRNIPSIAGTGDYGVTFVMSKNFDALTEGEFNLAHQINAPSHNNQINYEAALQRYIGKSVFLRCEYRGKSFMNNNNWSELYVFPGIRFTPNFYFAPKYVFGLTDTSPKNHAILDLVINF